MSEKRKESLTAIAKNGFIKKGHQAVWFTMDGHFFTKKDEALLWADDHLVEMVEVLKEVKKKTIKKDK